MKNSMEIQQPDAASPGVKNPRRRRLLANLALALLACVVSLLLAEIVLRVLDIGRVPAMIGQESARLYIPSKTVGLNYELRPGFEGRAYGTRVRINSAGMRGPERPTAKPDGTKRVLILGDSVAFGHAIEQPQIFPALLPERLARSTGTRVEVLNMGVPGYNSEQERVALLEKGFAWQPDVVLVIAVVNDAEPALKLQSGGGIDWDVRPPVYQKMVERYVARKSAWESLKHRVRLIALLDRLVNPSFLMGRAYLDYLRGLYKPDSPGWQSMQKALLEMKRDCEARGVGFVLALCPLPVQPEPQALTAIRNTMAEFARREGMTYIDLYAAQTQRPTRDVTVSPIDFHPNALGHRLIADALAPVLARALQLQTNSHQVRSTHFSGVF